MQKRQNRKCNYSSSGRVEASSGKVVGLVSCIGLLSLLLVSLVMPITSGEVYAQNGNDGISNDDSMEDSMDNSNATSEVPTSDEVNEEGGELIEGNMEANTANTTNPGISLQSITESTINVSFYSVSGSVARMSDPANKWLWSSGWA